MATTTKDAGLAGLIEQLRAATNEAREAFGALTAEQLNWKPSSSEWSVGQCVEHLMKTNGSYFTTLEEVARGSRKSTVWERFSPLSPFWGEFLVKALEPTGKRKLKTTRKFQPPSDVAADVVEKFAAQQGQLEKLMEGTGVVNLRKVVITSPFNPMVTYRLFDAYRGLVAHERRHLAQARRVLESENFPRV